MLDLQYPHQDFQQEDNQFSQDEKNQYSEQMHNAIRHNIATKATNKDHGNIIAWRLLPEIVTAKVTYGILDEFLGPDHKQALPWAIIQIIQAIINDFIDNELEIHEDQDMDQQLNRHIAKLQNTYFTESELRCMIFNELAIYELMKDKHEWPDNTMSLILDASHEFLDQCCIEIRQLQVQ
tara:strand:- start:274 stop:813 length:540 start_codon:yes stop_codon:yes gene_type:complete